MKRIFSTIFGVTLTLTCGALLWAAFPPQPHSHIVNIDKVTGNWDSFSAKMIGQNSQSFSFTFTNGSGYVDIDDYLLGARISRQNTTYVDVLPTNVTRSDSNITFSINRTNIPPDGSYLMEVYAWEGATTNDARSFAQGKANVSHSLYSDTNSFPFPVVPTNLSDYLTITQAVATYALIGDLTSTGVLVEGTANSLVWTNGEPFVLTLNTNFQGDISDITSAGGFLVTSGNVGNVTMSLAKATLDGTFATDDELATVSNTTVAVSNMVDISTNAHTVLSNLWSATDTRLSAVSNDLVVATNAHAVLSNSFTIVSNQLVAVSNASLQNVVEDTTPQLGGDLDGQSTYSLTNMINGEFEGDVMANDVFFGGSLKSAGGNTTLNVTEDGRVAFNTNGFPRWPANTMTAVVHIAGGTIGNRESVLLLSSDFLSDIAMMNSDGSNSFHILQGSTFSDQMEIWYNAKGTDAQWYQVLDFMTNQTTKFYSNAIFDKIVYANRLYADNLVTASNGLSVISGGIASTGETTLVDSGGGNYWSMFSNTVMYAKIEADGDMFIGQGRVVVSNDVRANNLIIGDDDSTGTVSMANDANTYIEFTNDAINIIAGGEQLITLSEGAQDLVRVGDAGDVDIELLGLAPFGAYFNGASGLFTLTGNVSAAQGWFTNGLAVTNGLTVEGQAVVVTSRTVTAGTGLTGGGPLSTNFTMALDVDYTDARYLTSFTNQFQEAVIANVSQTNNLGTDLIVNGHFTNALLPWVTTNVAWAGTGNAVLDPATNHSFTQVSTATRVGKTYLFETVSDSSSGSLNGPNTNHLIEVSFGGRTNSIAVASASTVTSNSLVFTALTTQGLSIRIFRGTGPTASGGIEYFRMREVNQGDLFVAHNAYVASNLFVLGDATVAGTLNFTGSLSTDSNVTAAAFIATNFMCEMSMLEDSVQTITDAQGFMWVTNFMSAECDADFTTTHSNIMVLRAGRYKVSGEFSFTTATASAPECHFYTNGSVALDGAGNEFGWKRDIGSGGASGIGFAKSSGYINLHTNALCSWRIDVPADEIFTWSYVRFLIERR